MDTDGRGLILEVQPGDIQDRDGAAFVLRHAAPFALWIPSPGLLQFLTCSVSGKCKETQRQHGNGA